MKRFYEVTCAGFGTNYCYLSKADAEKIAKEANKTQQREHGKLLQKYKAEKVKFYTF